MKSPHRTLWGCLLISSCCVPNPNGYTVSTLAGTGAAGERDGPFGEATFSSPQGLALDSKANVLYVADGTAIRKLDLTSRTVTTLAGGADAGFADGVGGAAAFDQAVGICLVSDGLLVTDGKELGTVGGAQNQRIRHVSFDGTVTTLAGNGTAGYADGTPDRAEFDQPEGIWADGDGGIYVTDLFNYRVRELDSSGVSTFAGRGAVALPTDQDWVGLPPPAIGITGAGQANGQLALPWAIVGDGRGDLLVGDAAAVEWVTAGSVAQAAGNPNAPGTNDGPAAKASFDLVLALAWAPGGLVVGDESCVRELIGTPQAVLNGGTVTTLAGLCGQAYQADFADGPGPAARFSVVTGLAADGIGTIYVSDAGNARIRRMNR